MPKKKTKKAVAKRFKKTATGKLVFGKASRGHLLGCKSRKRKRHLRHGGIVSASDMKRMGHMI